MRVRKDDMFDTIDASKTLKIPVVTATPSVIKPEGSIIYNEANTSIMVSTGLAWLVPPAAEALSLNGIAINGNTTQEATASAANSIALGQRSSATGIASIAVGSSTGASAAVTSVSVGSITIGGAPAGANAPSNAGGEGSIAIGSGTLSGSGASTNGLGGIAIGGAATGFPAGARTVGNAAISIGSASSSSSDGAVALGPLAVITTSTAGIAIGRAAILTTSPNSIAIGFQSSSVGGSTNVALGYIANASAAAGGAISIGQSTTATGLASIVLGSAGSVTGSRGVLIGSGTVALTNANPNTIIFQAGTESMRFLDPTTTGNFVSMKTQFSTATTPAVTLTAAQLIGGIVLSTSAGPATVTFTLPTGAELDTALQGASSSGLLYVGMSFQCVFYTTTVTVTIAFAGSAGTTAVGVSSIIPGASQTVVMLRTAAATWTAIIA